MISVRRRAALTLMAAAAIPGTAAAQACGLVGGSGMAANVGIASYDVGSGLSGATLALDATAALPEASVRAGYRTVLFDGPDPHIGRAAVAVPLPLPLRTDRITLCGTGHAGAARLVVDGEGPTVVAGGVGLRIASALSLEGGRAVPYGEVRGLVARSMGTLLGVDVEATGLALGVEGGVQATFGRVTARLAGSLDGFDDGLGLTPYPTNVVEIGVGVRF